MRPEVTALTDEEREIYLKLQAKVGWKRTGTDVFESFFPILPMVPSELAVVREIDGVKHVLMWRRKDAHYDGWHMPGGYILLGESDHEWIKRVFKKEVNLRLTHFQFIRRFNTRPDTDWVPNHQMAHFFLCEVEGEPTNGKFFPLDKPPEDTLGHHKHYVDCLRAHLMRMETMRKTGIKFDFMECAPDWQWRCVWYLEPDPVFVPRGMRGWQREDFASLDEASKCQEKYGGRLIDDQGLQIL